MGILTILSSSNNSKIASNMSYCLTPIAVSLQKIQTVIGDQQSGGFLRRLLGSPADRVIRTLKRKYSRRFQDDTEHEEDLSLEQALTDLLANGPLNPAFGHRYGYAVELLCLHFGEVLDNSAWSSMRTEWAEQVQEAMTQLGIDSEIVSVTQLMYRGSPIAVPEPGDFPSIGFLRREEIGKAAAAIDSASLSSVDEEVQESIMQVREWLERCEELNCDLVCFYY